MLGHPIEPHRIMRAMATGANMEDLLQHPAVRNAALCCSCGVCEVYACPMGLFPRKINTMLKGELGKAGIRYQSTQDSWEANPIREARLAPSERTAARAGVRKYYDYEIRELQVGDPSRVEIPVNMHIGAPAVPVVNVGDHVNVGDLIAQPPEGAMGALIHASISGRVDAVGNRIVIVKD